ncbi:hypothetical protein CEXT_721151 [Caerostris extrusa]|uniref:MD-2-related lipid-recognition domain-containing protein n=1 Tax=Caerostris extrusa TaxID=172846 RepID=A0AAV4T684_CAEEX|nr:hypothetical protein CEXT_721151 [Caerostris extrusa]
MVMGQVINIDPERSDPIRMGSNVLEGVLITATVWRLAPGIIFCETNRCPVKKPNQMFLVYIGDKNYGSGNFRLYIQIMPVLPDTIP